MSYALFQHSITPLDAGKVGRALDALPWLVRADAPQLVRRAFGVLVDRLSRTDAEALARALADQEQPVEIVDQDWLSLPPPRACRRAEIAPRAFVHHDVYGRASELPWRRVLLLAAGRCVTSRRVPGKKQPGNQYLRPSTGWGSRGLRAAMTDPALGSSSYEYREHEEVVLEILSDEPARYRIHLDRFDYSYLGERRGHSAAQNFPLLVRDLVGRAHEAARTQGVVQLAREAAGRPPRYPGERELEREIAWTLWRCCGPGARLDGGAPYRAAPSAQPRLSRPLASS